MNSNAEYNDSFYENNETEALRSAKIVVPLVLEILQPKSVVDIGCGTGGWLSVFTSLGQVDEACGVDGGYVNRDSLLIPADCFVEADLSQPLSLDRKYDLAVSLEVAEHLPQSSAECFVRSLCSASDCILFSAAIPDQGGTHHVNEQWPEYWRVLFEKHDFVVLDPIRHQVMHDRRVSYWYRQNIFLAVCVEKAEQPSFRKLPRLGPCNDPGQLYLISGETLDRHLGLRPSLRRIPGQILIAIQRRLRNWVGSYQGDTG
jgi:SAM-dependent methyltransferase